MSDRFSTPQYTKLIPSQFKQIEDRAKEDLAKYQVNPVMITAWLMEQMDLSFNFYSGVNMDRFKLERRFSDVFYNQDFKISDTEIYKGYLAFKGTRADLVYLMRQINMQVEVYEMLASGIIDDVYDIRKVVNGPDGEEHPKFFKITNPTNVVKIGQRPDTQDMNNACKIKFSSITVNLNEATMLNIIDSYNDLSRLLVNRLFVGAHITDLSISYAIKDIADNIQLSDELFMADLKINPEDSIGTKLIVNNTSPFKLGGTSFKVFPGMLDVPRNIK